MRQNSPRASLSSPATQGRGTGRRPVEGARCAAADPRPRSYPFHHASHGPPPPLRRGRTGMLTILLDGVAYGMLLFVLASGLSVTLGLMNFINLAHGAFAMVGGYVTALLMNRAGVAFPSDAPCGLPHSGDPRRRARAHALSAALWRKSARSGAVHHRPRPDGDADRRLPHRRRAAAGSSARHGSAGASRSMASASASIGCSSSSSAGSSPPPCRRFSSRPGSARS